jgi:hypothetical protein
MPFSQIGFVCMHLLTMCVWQACLCNSPVREMACVSRGCISLVLCGLGFSDGFPYWSF